MSVNGQDPRANVYLLDGTLLNDFTNGPAGSAAGTALGMETVREFRVEANTYSAEFGRNVGGQINAITKSGTNRFTRQRCSSSTATTRSTRATTSTSATSPTSRATSSAARPAARSGRIACSSSPATRRCARTSAARSLTTRAGRQRAAGHSARAGRCTIDPAIRPYLDEFPLANGENLGGGLAALHVSVRPAARRSTSSRARVDAVLGRRRADVRPLHVRRHRAAAADRLSRSFRARSSRATSS